MENTSLKEESKSLQRRLLSIEKDADIKSRSLNGQISELTARVTTLERREVQYKERIAKQEEDIREYQVGSCILDDSPSRRKTDIV